MSGDVAGILVMGRKMLVVVSPLSSAFAGKAGVQVRIGDARRRALP